MATQRNYAQQMDAVLAGLGGTRPRLLLHACCGPCSSAVLEQLCRYFEITVLYYNPNTWPAAEYYRRGEELQKFVAAAHPLGVTVVEDTYDLWVEHGYILLLVSVVFKTGPWQKTHPHGRLLFLPYLFHTEAFSGMSVNRMIAVSL